MEDRFGHDFSGVRIHNDGAAQASAADVGARAYTVGRHIVFGSKAPSLDSLAGRRLLGHELTHVVQQSRGTGLATGIDPDPALEREADRTGSALAAGRAIATPRQAPIALQREPEAEGGAGTDESFPRLEKIAQYVGQALGFSEGTSRVVAASLEGGISGFMQRWHSTTKALLGKELKQISWLRDIPELYKGYLIGLLEGVVSPATDLFSIGEMIENLIFFVKNVGNSALTKAAEIAQDLSGVGQAIRDGYGNMKAAIKKQLHDAPREVLKALIGIFSSNGGLVEKAVGVARSVGRSQGEGVAKAMEAPFEHGQKPVEPEQGPHGPFGWIAEKVGKGRDSFIESPWAKVGNKAGYALGFAFIQVVMLLFSEGFGNVLGIFARSLSGLAKAGTLLGRTLEGIAKFVAVAGKFINMAEEGVHAATTFLMKPLMPILEPILKPFGEVLERLGKTLRKLFGVAEKDASAIAATTAAKAISEPHMASPAPAAPHSGGGAPAAHGGTHAPTPVKQPKPVHADAPPAHPDAHPATKASTRGDASPHAVAPEHSGAPKAAEHKAPAMTAADAGAHPASQAQPAPPAAKHETHGHTPAAEPSASAKAAHDPHAAKPHAKEGSSAKSSTGHDQASTHEPHDPAHKPPPPGSDAAHKPLAEPEAVTAGGEVHHTQVTPDGIELCSPKPCPNLKLVYKKQLDASPELKAEMNRIDAMRKAAARLDAMGKPDEDLAKRISKEAAQLQKKLEAAKLGKPTPKIGQAKPKRGASKAVKDPLQTGPYSRGEDPVAGHHVHQSASMSPAGVKSSVGNPNHPDALSVKQGVPGFTEEQHKMASSTQRNMNRAMHGEIDEAKVGEVTIKATGTGTSVTPSLDAEDLKAYYSLRAAGRSPDEAFDLVMRSREQIEKSGTKVIRVPKR